MSELPKSVGESKSVWLGRNYAIYWGGSLSVAIALWVQRLTVAWLAWEITGSGFWLGLVATADLLPSIVLGPPAGILADRFNRKRLTYVCQTANVAVVLALAAIVSVGLIDEYWLLGFAIVSGVIASVQQPVRMSLTATLVEKPQIARAVALMSINAHASRFAGPAIVGPILAFGNASFSFYTCAALYGAMVLALPFLRVGDRERKLSKWKGFKAEFSLGLKFTTMHPAVGPIIYSFLLLSVFGRSIFELLPGIADGIFSEGAEGFSILAVAVGTGTVLSCFWLAHRPDVRCTFATVIGFMFVFGAAGLALSQATVFWAAVAFATVAAFAVTTSTIGSAAVIQTAVPDEIRGRVLGIFGALYRAAPAVGAVGMGWASDVIGLRWPVAIGAAVCLGWWLLMQALKPRIEARFEAEGD